MDNEKSSNLIEIFKSKKEWIKYRWEFMRRDPDFIRAFDRLLNLMTLYEKGEIPEEELDEAEINYRKEFDLRMPLLGPACFDRTKSYDDIVQEKGEKSFTIFILGASIIHNTVSIMMNNHRWNKISQMLNNVATEELSPEQYSMLREDIFQYLHLDGGDIQNDHLRIDIDLNRVSSITALKRVVNMYIDLEWKSFLQKNPERPKSINRVDFDKIIEVGDSKKAEKGISWDKLATKVFPNDPNGPRKAKQHYARYEELINGGWRMFRFP
jgi:hypothetical protein